MIPSVRTTQFLRTYLRDGAGPFREEEMLVEVGGEPREATLYLPDRPRPAPGWVVLHGLTVPGRRHKAMTRFVRSLAGSGAAVLVPDVPAWRELRLDLQAARQTIAAGAHLLAHRPEVRPGGVGAIGFSFGATQAIAAYADPDVRRDLKAVVSFGGYADVRRIVNSLFLGEHEWDGSTERLDPDPYGRWIMAGNYLTRIPEFAGMTTVQQGAHALAREAGRRGDWSWDPVYDPFKAEIRRTLSPGEQKVWDVLAPATGAAPADPALVRHIAEAFVPALHEADPGLDPSAALRELQGRVVLSHGRADRLIPYTETLRLQSLMPPGVDVSVAITGLFAHSSHAGWMHPMDPVREAGVFIRLLNQALASV
jgi:pimeloyl-ACP methyl ester carboxylesterase